MRRFKFTMIELLITMSVIAILAGMIMSGAMMVRNKGAEVETQSRITALKQAIVAYEAEYGALPCSFLRTEVWSTDASDSNATYDKLIETLCQQNSGQSGTGCAENVRKIQFLKPMGEPNKPYTDAWENRFLIKLDVGGAAGTTAYDNIVKDPDLTPADQHAGVLIYSKGSNSTENDYGRIKGEPEWKKRTKSGESPNDNEHANDDLRSW